MAVKWWGDFQRLISNLWIINVGNDDKMVGRTVLIRIGAEIADEECADDDIGDKIGWLC